MFAKIAAATVAVAYTLSLTSAFAGEIKPQTAACSTHYATERSTNGQPILTVVTTCSKPHTLVASAAPVQAPTLD